MNVFKQKTQKQKETRKNNSSNNATAPTIGEQSASDCGGRLGEGGCKDGISVESAVGAVILQNAIPVAAVGLKGGKSKPLKLFFFSRKKKGI